MTACTLTFTIQKGDQQKKMNVDGAAVNSDRTLEEALQTEVDIIEDLPLIENSPIECVQSSPTSSSAAPLEAEDAPVPTQLQCEDNPGAIATTNLKGSSVPTPVGRKTSNSRRSFTTEFKLECVEHAERTKNKTGTARKFDVNRRRVQEWCTQKEKLMAVPKQKKRLSSGKRQGVAENNSDDIPAGGEPTNSDPRTGNVVDPKASETPIIRAMQSIDSLTPDAIMDSIVRGHSVADLSILPASMIKMVQDLSAEVASQNAKASMESMLRETSLEMFIQKGMGSSPRDADAGVLVPELQGGVGMPGQQCSATGEAQAGTIPVIVADEAMETDQLQQQAASSSAPVTEMPLPGPMMDVTVQTAILDALVQVATSMQMTANDLLQSLTVPTSVNSSQQPSMDGASSPTDVTNETPLELNSDCLEESQDHSTPSSPLVGVPEATILQEALQSEETPISSANTVHSSATQTMSSLRTRVKKYYTVDFKLDCVACAESSSKCAAARRFNVDRRRVQDWSTQKKKLLHLKSISSVESKPDESDIEERLAAVVKQHLESGKPLTRKMVKDEALKLFRECGNTAFIPNVGWVARFMIRNDISLINSGLSHAQSLPSAATSEVGNDSDSEYNVTDNTCTDS